MASLLVCCDQQRVRNFVYCAPIQTDVTRGPAQSSPLRKSRAG